MIPFLLLIIPTFILGLWAQMKVGSTYRKYSQVKSRGGITGAEAASYVMRQAGISDVDIVAIRGQLTDHYDPRNRRLALSQDNYHGTSLAALGVAAHEAGHAIQHHEKYAPLEARMALVPATSFASKALPVLLLISIFGAGFIGFATSNMIILGVIAIYLVLTLFQLITLPVEFDASKRAREHLLGLGIIQADERHGVVQTLNAAGWTYVAAFVSSLATLLYYVMIFLGNRD
ncbi:MAG: zinc metallopeptidase [Verrucomicrobiota bacterium]